MSVVKTIRRAAVPIALAAAAICLPVAAAVAAAPSNGCPDGYQVMSVADLSQLGYLVPAQVDNSTSGVRSFGSVGNDDGWVCGVRLGHQMTSFGQPVYNFWDNTLHSS